MSYSNYFAQFTFLCQALLEKQKEVEIQLELKKRVEECEREKSDMSKNVLEMQKEVMS